jgi:O-6-methylguanine DNA methyltransferase
MNSTLRAAPPLTWLGIATADGEFRAGYSTKGLAALRLPSKRKTPAPPPASGGSAPLRRWHECTTAALNQVLAGRPITNLPPLDWSAATDFQQKVWAALQQIPTGKTLSYGEIARAVGKPKAGRAVGGACGANPIPGLVPCHRVLAANQKLGGFSCGLDWKRTLLAREGVRHFG